MKKTKLINKLVNFENKIADLFNNKKIKAPIHLYSGNESQIIKIFQKVRKNDWVLCSWRSHYQCLLKGVPEKLLIKYKILSSAIVGGNAPIAVGIAKALKIKKSKNKVLCFVGDMTSETGIVHECIKYSLNYNLPIIFVIEDNNLSVCTDTRKTWKQNKLSYEQIKNKKIIFYKYKNKYPHAGAGIRVQF